MPKKPTLKRNKTLDPDRIRDALERLIEKDPKGKRVFGAEAHLFKLLSPAHAKQVALFEKKNGVKLPADYRKFLTDLGNGGAGPYYGILPLGDFGDGPETVPSELALAFPHRKHWNGDAGYQAKLDELSEAIDAAAETGGEKAEEAAFERYDRHRDIYFDSRRRAGSFPICHFGCNAWILLVLNGKERGNLWFDDRGSDGGISPLTIDPAAPARWDADWEKRITTGTSKARVTFAEWYNLWLDRALRQLRIA